MPPFRERRLKVEVRLARKKLANVALFNGFKRTDRVCISLGAVESRDQVVAKGDQGSAVTSFGVDGSADGVVEVEGAVWDKAELGRMAPVATNGLEQFKVRSIPKAW